MSEIAFVTLLAKLNSDGWKGIVCRPHVAMPRTWIIRANAPCVLHAQTNGRTRFEYLKSLPKINGWEGAKHWRNNGELFVTLRKAR